MLRTPIHSRGGLMARKMRPVVRVLEIVQPDGEVIIAHATSIELMTPTGLVDLPDGSHLILDCEVNVYDNGDTLILPDFLQDVKYAEPGV